MFWFFSLSAELAAVTASGVESDISDLPTLMIREVSERAARLVICRGKQIDKTPRWRLQNGDGRLCTRHHQVGICTVTAQQPLLGGVQIEPVAFHVRWWKR